MTRRLKSGIFAIFVTTSTGGHQMYHTFKDHQGSLAAAVHGNTVERLSHDPWGRRRNPAGFGYDNVSHTFDRGFTGHEHLSAFGLVNMDGRVYDPVMSCFLSPDLYTPGTADPRSYNRFAYCMHNPLRYVDPSGWRPRQPAPGSTPSTGDFIREIYAYSEKAYEPRDFGLHQLPTSDAIVVWMEENQLHGGGGGFYDNKGNYLGTNESIEGKVFVFCSENPEAKIKLKEIKRFFKGKDTSLTLNDILQYFIEIEPSRDNRQKMLLIVSQDNGKGGTADCNNREYGGYICNGMVIEVSPGPIRTPLEENEAKIELPKGYSTFHSHPSGYVIERDRTNLIDSWWNQPPSEEDIINADHYTHYVFGRWTKNVYIYNRNGVQAVIREKRFTKIGL